MCCHFPSIQDIKRTCSFDDLNIPVRVLCRWRINLFGIISLPVIAWVILARYIAMTNNVSFNPEEEILNESCYLSEYGCCEIKDYCWSNGVRLLIPQHHYYLNLPKEDPEGVTKILLSFKFLLTAYGTPSSIHKPITLPEPATVP